MTEYLARISARKPFLIIAIWVVIGLVAGGFAVDAEIAPWPPPLTDFLDRATTTGLSSAAARDQNAPTASWKTGSAAPNL